MLGGRKTRFIRIQSRGGTTGEEIKRPYRRNELASHGRDVVAHETKIQERELETPKDALGEKEEKEKT